MSDIAIDVKKNTEAIDISAGSIMQNLITSLRSPSEKSEHKMGELNPGKSFQWKTSIIPLVYHKGRLLLKGTNIDISSCFSLDGLFPSRALKNPHSQRCSCCSFNNLFAKQHQSYKCIQIHTFLALTLKEGHLFSLSFKETKAGDLKLLLAAIDLVGGELSQYQVDMQISFSYQSRLCPYEVRFSNLKKLKKKALNLPNPSLQKYWKPDWLRQVNSKVSKLIELPVLGEHGTH